MCWGGVLGTIFYIRIPLAASSGPPPINWGYADNWTGFWWLVSANAYRPYLFGVPFDAWRERLSLWASTITIQYNLIGFAFSFLGLSMLDRTAPRFRTFSLLWFVPVTLYSIIYYTRDSEIYLLPSIWVLSFWLVAGVVTVLTWVEKRRRLMDEEGAPDPTLSEDGATELIPISGGLLSGAVMLSMAGLVLLLIVRLPIMSLRMDDEARQFLQSATEIIEPGSIVVSSSDAETFALWYGAWGTGQLRQQQPEPIFVNYALQQFLWYRRLLGALYPDVSQIDLSLEELLAEHGDHRPVFLSEQIPVIPNEQLEPIGRFWRYHKE